MPPLVSRALRDGFALALGLISSVGFAKSPELPSLEGTWRLVRIDEMNDTVWRVEPPSEYALVLTEEGVSGRAACNVFRGDFQLEQSHTSFLQLAVTRAFCHDDGVSDAYVRFLPEVRSWIATEHALFLATWADGAILTFVRELPNTRFIGVCEDGSSVDLVAAKQWAGLSVDGRFHMLPRVISASGVRWADEDFQAWNQGPDLMLEDLAYGRSTNCRLEPAEP